jgi:photosystem II stability/assembly factor-like uncharacterized protein
MNESSLERALRDLHFELPAGVVERAKRAASDQNAARVAAVSRARTHHLGERADGTRGANALLVLIAAALAVAIVLSLVFASRALHLKSQVPAHPQPSPSVLLQSPRMPSTFECSGYQPAAPVPLPIKPTSATSIWAEGALLSTDGGIHWRDTSPAALRQDKPSNLPGSQLPPGFADFFLDGGHAWEARAVNYGSTTSCYDHVVVFSTSDGGQTWLQSTPISINTGGNPLASPFPCAKFSGGFGFPGPSPSPGPQCPAVHGAATWISFLDSSHGWLATNNDSYATSDGGRTWTFFSSRNLSGCQFLSLSVWWCGMSRTRDGGTTWSLRQLPCACTTSPNDPVFLNPSIGMVHTLKQVTTATTETDTYGLYRTTDGGDTWHELTVPFDLYYFAMAYVDAQNVWVVADPLGWSRGAPGPYDELYHSSDGGLHWTLLQRNMPTGPGDLKLWFLDPAHGFVSQDRQLFATQDGGRTWRPVLMQLTT